jgi:TolA-binding protein
VHGQAATEKAAPDRLGELLVARGHITPAQLADALALQRGRDIPLGQLLVEQGLLTRLQLAGVLTEQWASRAVTTPARASAPEARAPRPVSPLRPRPADENGRAPATDAALAARVDQLSERLERLEASVEKITGVQEDAAPRQTVEDLRQALRELWKVQKDLLQRAAL